MGASRLPAHWLLDALSDGLLLLDGEERIVGLNRAAAGLLGLDPQLAVGRRLREQLGQSPPRWRELLQELLRDERPGGRRERRVESEEGVRHFEAEAHRSPGDGMALVFRDVTDRRRDEEQLRLRDRALAASTHGMVLTDATLPDHPIIYVNPAFTRITGYAVEEAVGRNCRFLQGDDRDQPGVEEIRAAVREGRSCTVTLRNYTKDGTLFWNELSISPVHDEAGQLTHFVGIQQDVTESQRAQRALLERNQQLKAARDELALRNLELHEATHAKDRFMATMSHEMRTPLNAILGYVELLNFGIAGELSDMQRAHLGRVEANGRTLLDLITDVLDFTRAEVGRLSLELRPLQAEAVLEEALELMRPHAVAKQLPLEVERPAQPLPLARADFRRLRQILLNLLSNAIKFTPHGRVTVTLCPAGDDQVAIEVQDTGIGIEPDKLPHVFTEFYQADSDLTREYGGTGLGLAISQRLARLMGGDISVRSAPGQGSTFTVVLPVAPAAVGSDTAPSGVKEPVPAEGVEPPVTVVAFGENDAALQRLQRRLAPQVRVIGTTAADHVAELTRREHPSLIVLDIMCQQGTGWEAAHAVREDAALDDVAMLLLPCIPEVEDDHSPGALDLGWVAVVPKPFSSDQLHRMVLEAAERGDGVPSSGAIPRDVLVVDDDPDAREIAARILAAGGASVRTAPDGEAGLAEMRRAAPDVAVLDLMMPVLDGFGVLAAMRSDPALRDIPVVVLTAKDLSEAERRFLSRTAETVLQKGVHSLSDVSALVLNATQRRERAAEV